VGDQMKTRLRTKEMDHPGNKLELLVLGQFVNSIDAGFQPNLAIARLKHNATVSQRFNARTRAQRERKIYSRGAWMKQVQRPDINCASCQVYPGRSRRFDNHLRFMFSIL
jgi:hypothetical protein